MTVAIQYFRSNSFLHRMDAFSKLIFVFFVGITAFTLSSPVALALLVLLLFGIIFGLGRIPFRLVQPFLKILVPLTVCLWFFQLVINRQGTVLASFGPLDVTSVGMTVGLMFGLRILCFSFASLIFVWTSDPKGFVIGLIRVLHVPYRIGYAVFIALRFVPLLENEARVIREAHAVRGVAEVSGRLEAWKRYTLPLLIVGIRKSENAAIAMDSRAFGAHSERTYVDDFHWTPAGAVFLATFVVLAGLLVALNLWLGADLFMVNVRVS